MCHPWQCSHPILTYTRTCRHQTGSFLLDLLVQARTSSCRDCPEWLSPLGIPDGKQFLNLSQVLHVLRSDFQINSWYFLSGIFFYSGKHFFSAFLGDHIKTWSPTFVFFIRATCKTYPSLVMRQRHPFCVPSFTSRPSHSQCSDAAYESTPSNLSFSY